MDPGEFMRGELARNAGIFLDDDAPTLEPEPDWEAIEIVVDRDIVRRILRDRGAPERDLGWLTASCPSLAAAEVFVPTPWMARDFTDHMED